MINFENFSKKKMFWTTVAAYITYFLIAVFAPVLTICIKYGLFTKDGYSEKVAISGWAAVLLLIVGVVGATLLKKAIKKIPDVKIKTARFKYTLETITGAVPPIVALYAIHLFEVNLEKAATTGYWIAIWFLIAAIFDGVVLSGIDRENRFRQAAAFDVEKEKRKDKV